MANQQHLALLKQGKDAWNTWRENNPTVQPDLSFAIIRFVNLSQANLSQANLSNTDLWQVNLSRAVRREVT